MNIIAYFSASNSLSTSLRADIENSRFWFFALLLVCTALVAIGVVMEELVEHREDKNHRWVVKPEWHQKIARLGWVLVIVGVIGEGIFEGATTWVDSILQDFNNTLLAIATQQAGDAKTSALEAAKASASAKSDAKSAHDEANAVDNKTKELDRQLASAKSQLEAVEAKRAALEASLVNMAFCTAPRQLPTEIVQLGNKRGSSVDSLRPFQGRSVTIEFTPSDGETLRAANQIGTALRAAGWIVEPLVPKDGIPDGVLVEYPLHPPTERIEDLEPFERAAHLSRDAAIAVVELLQAYGWEATLEPDAGKKTLSSDLNTMRIEVGLYPPVELVTPLGLKAFSALKTEGEQADAKRQEEMDRQINKMLEDMRARQDEMMTRFLTPEETLRENAIIDRSAREMKLRKQKRLYPCKPLPMLAAP